MDDRPLTPDSHRAVFDTVRRYGPTLAERVHGSARLAARQHLARRLTASLGRVLVDGLEHIPAEGPVLLAVNHTSFMDGPLVFGYVDRVVSCLVKSEAFLPAGGRTGRLLVDAAQIPVVRNTVDPAPVRLCLDVLRAGGVVGIFPEGTRGAGDVTTARPGVGYLARKTGALVVPVAVLGTSGLMRRRRFSRPTIVMHVGAPVELEYSEQRSPLNRGDWLATTEVVRARLAELVAQTRRSYPAPVHTGALTEQNLEVQQ